MNHRAEAEPRCVTTYEVMFFDTDCGGVVHNLAYLRIIEVARTRLGQELGLTLQEMTATRRFPVVLRTEIDYRKPAGLGDVLSVQARLESLERVRFTCAFELFRAPAELMASSRQTLALVDMPEAKVARLPESWATRWPGLVQRGRIIAR